MLKINECPRDAIQGLPNFIPTKKKIEYYQYLLGLGFNTIDFGSFVSPHAVPQMKDTFDVVDGLDMTKTKTKLLAIVGNSYGATQAASVEKISYIGYPFSISDTFMKKNINSDVSKGLRTIVKLLNICKRSKKELVVYISMAFGNPYEDNWSIQLLEEYVEILSRLGVTKIQLSDTTGEGTAESYLSAFSTLIPKYEHIEIGMHMHSEETSKDKIAACFLGGCQIYDTAAGGKGGCPLSGYEMVGNLKTCDLLDWVNENEYKHKIKKYDDLEKISKLFYNESL